MYPYATHRKLVADCEREGRSVRKFWSFTDETVEFEASIRKTALITDRTLFLRVLSKKSDQIADERVADKKETPSKGCLSIWR